MNPKYTVIIPSYNSKKSIRKSLDIILEQDFDEPYEIIVVDSSDDGSTPEVIRQIYFKTNLLFYRDNPSREMLKNHPAVNLIRLDRKTDQGWARNIGAGLSRGEYLFFIDADCVAKKDWMRRIKTLFDRGDYPAVGGGVINGNPETLASMAGYLLEFSDLFPGETAQWRDHLGSCNICYKKEIFLQYGGFPERLKFAVEDILYNWHLNQHGVRMFYDPDIPVVHYHRCNVKSFFQHQLKLSTGTVQMLRRTDLFGSSLVKHPFGATFVFPLMPFFKMTRTISRAISFQGDIFRRKPLLLPFLFLGIIVWTYGFFREVWGGEKDLKYEVAEIKP